MLDKFKRSELHYAAVEGDAARIAALVRSGADVNLADSDGWTPLHFAAQANSSVATQVLIDAGADVDAVDSYGNTPLGKAVFNSQGDGDVIAILRDAGADPTVPNGSGVSPLDLARTIANYDVAQFFVDLPVSDDAG